jgi:hypothetical protein
MLAAENEICMQFRNVIAFLLLVVFSILLLLIDTSRFITLQSYWTVATRLAISCNCKNRKPSSSLGFCASCNFSCHTKQESSATICSTDISLKAPLNISSVSVSSSAELISHATFPFSSTTSSFVMYLHQLFLIEQLPQNKNLFMLQNH